MPDERPEPLPLSGEEVQEAILYKVAESLGKTCHLKFDNAYTSFKAEIDIRLVLSDYGREVKDNHKVSTSHDTGAEATSEPRQVEAHVALDPTPPNQVRIETDQPVPVVTNEGGKRVIRNLKYAPRKSKQP